MPNDNPYAPPQTPVATTESLRAVPRVVVIAALAFALPIALSIRELIWDIPRVQVGEHSAVNLLLDAGVILLRAGLVVMLWRGHNWARFVAVAWVVVNVLDVLSTWHAQQLAPAGMVILIDWMEVSLWL